MTGVTDICAMVWLPDSGGFPLTREQRMDTSRLDDVLQQAVATGAVPNVTAVAADRNGIIYEGAAGPRVAGGAEAVTVDTHYRIMSMTKMVATTAALQQMENGTLDLDAPVEDYCPEFADLQVLDAPSVVHLAYRPGVPLTAAVWRRGIRTPPVVPAF